LTSPRASRDRGTYRPHRPFEREACTQKPARRLRRLGGSKAQGSIPKRSVHMKAAARFTAEAGGYGSRTPKKGSRRIRIDRRDAQFPVHSLTIRATSVIGNRATFYLSDETVPAKAGYSSGSRKLHRIPPLRYRVCPRNNRPASGPVPHRLASGHAIGPMIASPTQTRPRSTATASLSVTPFCDREPSLSRANKNAPTLHTTPPLDTLHAPVFLGH
jgi:hypothetical protein